ncbi:hypothetical protein OEN05_002353 [Enterococcus faecalis]|nr:hypothetical protein [Enterococcus faecalis]EKH7198473.1 hypothetical protein [Enterococcus faecalis]ELT9023516.1 hypothetical protein [Enterococcus faecalis]
MRLTVKLISKQEEFIVNDNSGKTLDDYYEELIDSNSSFIKIGNRILQKATIEYINAE